MTALKFFVTEKEQLTMTFKAGDVVRVTSKNPLPWWSATNTYTVYEDDEGLYVVDDCWDKRYYPLSVDGHFEIVPSTQPAPVEPDPFAIQTVEETIKLTKYKVGDKVFESSYEANIESLFQKTKQYIETNKTGKATTDEVLMKLIYWNRHDRNA
jgi:hypothetical protein